MNNDHGRIKEELFLLEAFRKFHSRRYKKKMKQSYDSHMTTKYGISVFGEEYFEDMEKMFSKIDKKGLSPEAKADLNEGKEAISKAEGSSFWDWDHGSFPYFWRWQPEIKNDLRDDTPLWFHPDLLPKSTTKRQKLPTDKGVLCQMVDKVVKVRDRRYIGKLLLGTIKSFTHDFAVPKGENDIRMVYDMTTSGLNNALWAPRFWMGTARNIIDCSTEDTCRCWRDVFKFSAR